MKKRVNIWYQSSDAYAFMTGVSFTSLLLNASEKIAYHVYILTTDMTDRNKKKFYRTVEKFPHIDMKLEFIDANMFEDEINTWNVPAHRGARVTYYKLLIGRIFDENSGVDRIIQIGADTLVTGSLEELPDFEFGDNPIAMNWSEKLYERHYPRKYKYCIAEMVYFNLPKWREHDCENRIKRHFEEIGEIYGSKDQGILNMEFQYERAQLPLKYNVYGITYFFSDKNKRRFNNASDITEQEIREAYKHPEIIHIPRTFLYRPHEEGSREPLKDMWWEYCRKSEWKDYTAKPPSPPLGAKEIFLRWVYLHTPKNFAEWFYIQCRHGYGFMNSVKSKPLDRKRVSDKYSGDEEIRC